MRGKYMINISFGKWFLENDTFTISLFNNSINEAKKLGGEGFLRKDILEHYEKEIKYRIEQFAYRLKDKEKIKQIVPSSILEDLAKQKKITIDKLIDDIHAAANKYDKNEDYIEYASFLQNLHIHKMHPKGSEALEKSLSEKRKLGSRTKPNYIYRSIKPIDKIIDDDKSELKNPPENPKIGDRHEAQGYTWKFMSDRTWIKIRKNTDEYEGTELLDMFNRSKLDRPMLKAILHYYDNDYFNEKDVMKAFEGSCKYIGRNQLKKDIGKDAMVKADPYKGDKNKIFERAKIKFPNPEIDNVYEDEETNTTWNWVYSKKKKGMGWKEIPKEKPISHFSLHGKDGEIEHDVEAKKEDEEDLAKFNKDIFSATGDPEGNRNIDDKYGPKGDYDSDNYLKQQQDLKKQQELLAKMTPIYNAGIKNPQKKPITDNIFGRIEYIKKLEDFKEDLKSITTLADDNKLSNQKTKSGYIKKDNAENDNFSVYEFYRNLFIEVTDYFITEIKAGKEPSSIPIKFLDWFRKKMSTLPSNAKKISDNYWPRFTKEKYTDVLDVWSAENNFKYKKDK